MSSCEKKALCVTGLTRNASKAKETSVAFDPLLEASPASGDIVSLKVLTRIGTNSDGAKCPGHSNATGGRDHWSSGRVC
jgi:hypothetical protein